MSAKNEKLEAALKKSEDGEKTAKELEELRNGLETRLSDSLEELKQLKTKVRLFNHRLKKFAYCSDM